jgi:hypothetical protein
MSKISSISINSYLSFAFPASKRYNSALMNLLTNKIISALLVVFFVVPFSSLHAAETTSASAPLQLSDLAIPKSLGKIDGRFVGTSKRWVIQIQDVHAHFTAQENISAIVDHLNAVYGIKTVGLEGGWLSTSFEKSWGLPNSREKQMLARALLEDFYLTGPGYAGLFSQTPIHLVGIEDAKLHEENRQTYLKHLAERDAFIEKVDAYEKKLSTEKQSVFSPELLSFDASLKEFREGKNAEKFLPLILSLAQKKAIDITQLDQIQLFSKIIDVQNSITKDKLESEAKRLMKTYKRNRLSFEDLLKSGIIPTEKLELYPEAQKYLNSMQLQDALSHHRFFNQIEQVIQLIKDKTFISEEEKSLDAKSERFVVSKKIILFQATPDDLKAFESLKEKTRAELAAEGLEPALDLGLHFFEIAFARDQIFFDKISSDPKLGGDIAIVTGGFHTDGLSSKLEQAGISYVIVTPDLGEDKTNEEIYFKRIRIGPPKEENPAVPDEAFAYEADYLRESFDRQRFPDSLVALTTRQATLPVAKGLVDPLFASKVPARKQTKIKAITDEAFMKLPPQEQLKILQRLAEKTTRPQQGGLPIYVIINGKKLGAYLEHPLNRSSFEAYKSDSLHAASILVENSTEIDGTMIGGRSRRVQFEIGKSDPNDFLSQPRIQRQLEINYGNRYAIIEDQNYESSHSVLPAVPGIFIVAVPILTGELRLSSDPAIRAAFFKTIEDLLSRFQTIDELISASA